MKFDNRPKFPRLQFLNKKREQEQRFLNEDRTLNADAIRAMGFKENRNGQR